MKKIISLLHFIVIVPTLYACGGIKANDNVITIKMTEEAKQYQEIVRQAGTKEILKEEYFGQVLTTLLAREEQTFPECDVENTLDSFECEDSKVYTLEKDNYENIIFYIHGGAWAFDINISHITFCDELVSMLNAKVYIPLYPLAPEATSEDGYAMIESLYKEILKEGKDIYLMGDSAGGNIALGLLYTIKNEGLKYPNKTVLISPCVDMSFTNEEMIELDETDPELAIYGCKKCAELWAGKDKLKDPKNSALYADVSGYPDTMIVQGTNDILYPDVFKFFEKLNDAGVNTTLIKGEGYWHVFPLYDISEKGIVINYITEFCLK